VPAAGSVRVLDLKVVLSANDTALDSIVDELGLLEDIALHGGGFAVLRLRRL
jgi:hypothetical protein